MLLKLFLAFTLIPIIELYILIKIGAVIGAFSTIVLVILTGAVGAYLARLQGMQTMFKVQARLQQGEMPAEEMLDAVIIFGAGILLLTPGLLTDLAGLLLLFPATRFQFKKWLRLKLDQRLKRPHIHIYRGP